MEFDFVNLGCFNGVCDVNIYFKGTTKCLKLGGINPTNRLLFIDCHTDIPSQSPSSMPSEILSMQPSGSPSSPPSSSSKPSSGAKDWTTAASSQIKITASDGAASDTFGVSVSVSGSVLAAGARYDDDKGSNSSGSVYIFKMNSITGAWDQVHKLVASDGNLSTTPYFRNLVSVSGNTLVAGAGGADSPGVTANGGDNISSAHVFEFEEDQSNAWVKVAKLTASDGAPHDWFGNAVATDGNVIIVCSPYDDDKGQESGSAYVFENDQNNDWVQ
eukprot:scaffold18064_cov28-Cyclotella_meneghiniana.AAC.1